MNTRDREVMDALARDLREATALLMFGNDIGIQSLAAYDALPDEGSASSEGAEAVYQVRSMFGYWVEVSKTDYERCEENERRISSTRPRPAQGEHEQRSCEESERRPIADEVVERALSADERMWALIAAAEKAGAIKDDDDEGSFWTLRCSDFAALESAHQRDLPAGSDASLPLDNLMASVAAQYPIAAIVRAIDLVAPGFAASYTRVATGEQPSCGQDPRDGWQPIETAPKDGSTIGLRRVKAFAGRWDAHVGMWRDSKGALRDPTHWHPDAAIAAQQRQGEQK